MEYSKKYIKSWFLENNPVVTPNIEDIYHEIEERLEGLSQQACRIELSSFLAVNYSNELLDSVESELYENYEDIVQEWSQLGIFKSEVACIVINLEMQIPDNPDIPVEDLIKSFIQEYTSDYI